MSAEPIPALRLVDAHGEVHESLPKCPSCAELQDQLDGAHKEIRAWRTRYAMVTRNREAEAEGNKFWPDAVILFQRWKSLANHPRSKWSAERFFLIEPFIKRHGIELCERAIDGHVFDPFCQRRKNGTTKRFDSWELLWRDEAHFEDAVNKAPLHANATVDQ